MTYLLLRHVCTIRIYQHIARQSHEYQHSEWYKEQVADQEGKKYVKFGFQARQSTPTRGKTCLKIIWNQPVNMQKLLQWKWEYVANLFKNYSCKRNYSVRCYRFSCMNHKGIPSYLRLIKLIPRSITYQEITTPPVGDNTIVMSSNRLPL